MRWTRTLVLGAVAVLSVAGIASAQIASPALTPGTANVVVSGTGFDEDPSFLPLNPSVMSWNSESVFGLGSTSVDRDQKNPKQAEQYSGTYGGFRWTGDKLAVGLETMSLDSDKNNVKFTSSTTNGGVSGKLADWFTLGGGITSYKQDTGAAADKINGWTAGGSAKLGEIFYVGVGTGRQSLDHQQTGNNYSDDRSVSEYGLAVYTGGKGGGSGTVWHLEYNSVDADDFTDPAGNKAGGFTRTTLTGEVNWNNILLSYSSYSVSAKTGKGTLDGSAVEAGWAMQKSFYVTARLQNNTEKNGSTKIADSNSMSINVGLGF